MVLTLPLGKCISKSSKFTVKDGRSGAKSSKSRLQTLKSLSKNRSTITQLRPPAR